MDEFTEFECPVCGILNRMCYERFYMTILGTKSFTILARCKRGCKVKLTIGIVKVAQDVASKKAEGETENTLKGYLRSCLVWIKTKKKEKM